MNARLTAGALCAVLFATPHAFATQARIDSLGGGVKQITIEDEVNIFDFPSLLVRYGNHVYLDNLQVDNSFPNGRFGFHLNLGDDTVLAFFGMHANGNTRPASTVAPGSTSASNSGFNPSGNAITGGHSLGVGFEASQAAEAAGGSLGSIGNVQHRYGMMFATVFGASTRFGAMLNVLVGNDDVWQPDGAKVDRGGMLFDFGLGLGLDLATSELELSVGMSLGFADDFRDAVSATTGQMTELLEHVATSHFGLRVAGRWTFDFFAQSKIVAYTQFAFGSQSVEQRNVQAGAFAPSGSYNGINWLLGADLRLEPFQGVIVSPGLGIRLAQQTLEGPIQVDRDADMLLSLPYYGVGVELRLVDWASFRFGASQSVNLIRESQTNAPTPGVTNQRNTADVHTHFAFGMGFHIPVSESTLTLDLNINPDIFINGPFLIAGRDTGTFGLTAAMKYAW